MDKAGDIPVRSPILYNCACGLFQPFCIFPKKIKNASLLKESLYRVGKVGSKTADDRVMNWLVPISRWVAWPHSAEQSDTPDVSFVEPMLRRRLSKLAKMSLAVAHKCAEGAPKIRFVFSSRHGDLARTTAMLASLADEEPLSPTNFSLSVLNASSGLFSILKEDTSPSTAISASESSFGYGLLEAAAQFAADPNLPVLYVYADEQAPPIYGPGADSPRQSHALALLLSRNATITLDCQVRQSNQAQSTEAHSISLLSSLSTRQAGEWHGEEKCWSWAFQ